MANKIVITSGVCSKCGHPQSTHEGNIGCTECGCDSIGSY